MASPKFCARGDAAANARAPARDLRGDVVPRNRRPSAVVAILLLGAVALVMAGPPAASAQNVVGLASLRQLTRDADAVVLAPHHAAAQRRARGRRPDLSDRPRRGPLDPQRLGRRRGDRISPTSDSRHDARADARSECPPTRRSRSLRLPSPRPDGRATLRVAPRRRYGAGQATVDERPPDPFQHGLPARRLEADEIGHVALVLADETR